MRPIGFGQLRAEYERLQEHAVELADPSVEHILHRYRKFEFRPADCQNGGFIALHLAETHMQFDTFFQLTLAPIC